MSFKDLRRNYEVSALNRTNLDEDPFAQFQNWFDLAKSTPRPDWLEINAMTLSTTAPENRVASRVVLLKDFSAEGFTFFTNYRSAKAKQLATNPNASLLFYWPHCERQVRIEGIVTMTDANISDEYFRERPRGSQLSAIASPQSQVIEDRSELESEIDRLGKVYEGQPIPRPEYWGGYRLRPERFEFWQGRPNRVHDRFAYVRGDINSADWTIARIAP